MVLWIAGLTVAYVAAHALLISRFPWFVDETIFATFTQAVHNDPGARFVALTDHKGLLLTWIGALLMHLGFTPIEALRFIAAASGYAAAVATGATVWRWMGSARAGLVTGALVGFVPYLFVETSVGAHDAFIAGGSAVALYLQLELARRQRLGLALGLGMVFGALLLAKPTGAVAVALTPFSLLMFDWGAPDRRARLLRWGALVVAALVVMACLAAIPKLSPISTTPAPHNYRTLSDLFSAPFATVGKLSPYVQRTYWAYLTPPGVLLAVWGIVQSVQTCNRLGLVMTVWTLAATAAFLLLTTEGYPRYGLQAAAPACVLILIGVGDLLERVSPRLTRRGGLALLAVLAIPAVVFDARVLAHPTTAPYPGLDREQYESGLPNREPIREAAERALAFAGGHFDPSDPPQVAGFTIWPWAAKLVLAQAQGNRGTVPYIDGDIGDHDLVNAARFVIFDGGTPPDWLDLHGATIVGRWDRPGGGQTVVLFDRGAR